MNLRSDYYELLSEDERKRYPDKGSIIRYIQEIDRRDLTRPSAEHNAYALYHYIFNIKSILENSEILRNKVAAYAQET